MIRNCYRYKLPLPPELADAPDLGFGLELFYDAYWDLSTCRPAGWGATPIPWSSIIEWAQLYDLDYELTEDLIYYTRSLDNEFLTWAKEQEGK